MSLPEIKHDNTPVNGITLGNEVTDSISGFKGIATSRTTFLNHCVHIGIRARSLTSDGKPVELVYVDEKALVEYNKDRGYREVLSLLGKKAKDKLTGFSGTIAAVTEYVFMETRYAIQPRALEKGLPVEDRTFDLSQIEVEQESVSPVKQPAPHKRTGGPGDIAPRPASARR